MCLSLFARKACACCALALGLPALVFGQGTYAKNGSEYAIAGSLPGDQVRPALAVGVTGGYLVWEDNVTQGSGLAVSAYRLDNNLSPAFAPFRVNTSATGDHEHPQATLLNDGGAAFVWQGGNSGRQHILARFLSSSNTWLNASDILVNSATNVTQLTPTAATLTNGNVVVVYASVNQQGPTTLQDIYFQILSPSGQKVGNEVLVNQFTAFNQRAPAVAALAGGGFVVTWVSEQQRAGNDETGSYSFVFSPTNLPSVDIFARQFTASGGSVANEFLVNGNLNVCGSPTVAGGADGGFMIAWSQKNAQIKLYSWDIYARGYSNAGVGGAIQTVNTYLYGDQFLPRISALGSDYLAVWTSLAQDGSREGVFGRFLRSDATGGSPDFQINTTTISQQMHPTAAADKFGRFLVAWTSFIGGDGSFDLFAQRYVKASQPLLPMQAPFVHAPFVVSNNAYVPVLQVSWSLETGLPIDHYEVFVDGSPSASASITTNVWIDTAVTANSTHSFQVAYVTLDGRRSPLSPSASGSTWQGMVYAGNLPVEWVAQYYGWGNPWPSPDAALANGGPTLLQVFLSGGSPLDPNTWLRTQLVNSPQGYFLSWNPHSGLVYQVQISADLANWSNAGPPRFASGNSDSIYVGGNSTAYYRVLLLR